MRKALIAASLAWLCALGDPAAAGAWPRGKGNHFLSFTLTHDLDQGGGIGQSYYHEWGIGKRATLKLEQGSALTGSTRIMLFYTRDLPSPIKSLRIAWAVGAGQLGSGAGVSGGLAFGRDIRWRGLEGWASAELNVEGSAQAIEGNANFTYGMTMANGVKYYGQLLVGSYLGSRTVHVTLPARPFFGPAPQTVITWYPPEVRLGVNAAIPLGRRFYLDVGLSHGVQEGGTPRVKLGLWKEF